MARRPHALGWTPSSGRRLAGIEGLRAIAAGSIVVVHTFGEASKKGSPDLGRIGAHLPDLSFGVTLFFALSGFLLYRPFASAMLAENNRPSFGKYFRNRALRILPAYWVILLVCSLMLGGVYSRNQAGRLVDHRITDPGLLARAGFFVQDYQPRTLLTGIGPAWSLAVEVVFYLVLPLLVLLAWKLGSHQRSLRRRVGAALVPALLLLAIGLLGKAIAAFVVSSPPGEGWSAEGWGTNWHSVIERSFFCQADLFTFGMALAVLHGLREQGHLGLPRHWRSSAAIVALGAYLITARVSYTQEQLTYSLYNTLMAFACGLVLALVVLPAETKRSFLLRVLETRPMIALGIISYSVFLWHYPLIRVLRAHGLTFDGRAGFFANIGIIGAITILLSTLTYRFVEAPGLRLRFARPLQRDVMPAGQTQAAP
jgi:peptidoglycan/LPS O-acetylase OafA/YrhL